MENLIQTTKKEIEELENEMNKVSDKCTHMTCPDCELRIIKEAEEKILIRIKIDEKNSLLEKLNQYGINQ